jgi:CheY-like chemotaxis protein
VQDLEMPILNGLEATRAIRVMEANGRLKGRHTIIAVSANAREHYVDESFSAGMDGYLRKPYTKAELEQVIRTFCKSRT